jgi:hypothetical protein
MKKIARKTAATKSITRAHDNRLDKFDDPMRRVITTFEKKLSIPFPR